MVEKERYIKCEVTHKAHTNDAVLIAFNGETEWVPRSLIKWSCDRDIQNLRRNEDFQLEVVEWKADQIGLIY